MPTKILLLEKLNGIQEDIAIMMDNETELSQDALNHVSSLIEESIYIMENIDE